MISSQDNTAENTVEAPPVAAEIRTFAVGPNQIITMTTMGGAVIGNEVLPERLSFAGTIVLDIVQVNAQTGEHRKFQQPHQFPIPAPTLQEACMRFKALAQAAEKEFNDNLQKPRILRP